LVFLPASFSHQHLARVFWSWQQQGGGSDFANLAGLRRSSPPGACPRPVANLGTGSPPCRRSMIHSSWGVCTLHRRPFLDRGWESGNLQSDIKTSRCGFFFNQLIRTPSISFSLTKKPDNFITQSRNCKTFNYFSFIRNINFNCTSSPRDILLEKSSSTTNKFASALTCCSRPPKPVRRRSPPQASGDLQKGWRPGHEDSAWLASTTN
jgi:hypothetical protein